MVHPRIRQRRKELKIAAGGPTHEAETSQLLRLLEAVEIFFFRIKDALPHAEMEGLRLQLKAATCLVKMVAEGHPAEVDLLVCANATIRDMSQKSGLLLSQSIGCSPDQFDLNARSFGRSSREL